jgi:holliday junction DNA helicase RuvA
MIRLLKGTVHSNEDRTIILFVNGVGYHVFVTNNVVEENDEELTLYIHTHVREDDIKLFGFRTKKELSFFELLLTINGVGPKMALEILNEPPELIQNAIFKEDLNCLTKISGVGKKIAERICLELKSKVDPVDQNSTPIKDINEDLIVTLESLGYKRHHIKKVISEIDEDITETEEIIRVFLQRV